MSFDIDDWKKQNGFGKEEKVEEADHGDIKGIMYLLREHSISHSGYMDLLEVILNDPVFHENSGGEYDN